MVKSNIYYIPTDIKFQFFYKLTFFTLLVVSEKASIFASSKVAD